MRLLPASNKVSKSKAKAKVCRRRLDLNNKSKKKAPTGPAQIWPVSVVSAERGRSWRQFWWWKILQRIVLFLSKQPPPPTEARSASSSWWYRVTWPLLLERPRTASQGRPSVRDHSIRFNWMNHRLTSSRSIIITVVRYILIDNRTGWELTCTRMSGQPSDGE